MQKSEQQNDGADLLDKLSKLPRSSRVDPFSFLSDHHKKEWQAVKHAWADGTLAHISMTQLSKSVIEHFSMKSISYDKFKKELTKTEDA